MHKAETRDRRFAIGPVRISAVTMADTLATLDRQVSAGEAAYVCVANVRTTVLAQKDEAFCRIQNGSLLTIPDGMPLVWFAHLAGVSGVERVTGPDLMMEVLAQSREKGYSHYFYGDTEDTLTKMCSVLERDYPEMAVDAMYSPPFRPLTEAEFEETIAKINRLKPTFVWVALGAPKQERWMARVVGAVDTSILLGVGAAFRFLIGEYRHPPGVIQKCGLEGLCWRFLRNPFSEAKWYAYHVPAFGWLLGRMLADRLLGKVR